MNNYTYWSINGHDLEFLDDIHQYICDGRCVPSVTQVIKTKFGNKYDGVDKATLQRAAEKGTEVHKAIEDLCKEGKESDLPEVRNFKFLQNAYKFEVVDNEVPVILFQDDEPICAGRLDLVLKMSLTSDRGNSSHEAFGLGDIKRTSSLDKDYLALQLNLYRIAYQQCYGNKVEFLRGVHLRGGVRKFVNIPIKESLVWDLLNEWKEKVNE